MSLPSEATRVYLANRPKQGSVVDDDTFKIEKIPIANLRPQQPGQVLVKVDYVSVDPAMRGWIEDARSYMPPVEIGATMRAGAIGTVVETKSIKFSVGEQVNTGFAAGWTDYALCDEAQLMKLQVGKDIQAIDYMGPLGATGLTAYFGLDHVAKLKAGETCVISGAAGAVGIIACQIAKIKGAKVIAIAGGAEKCKYLEEELGVDKALDYKSASFVDDFKKHVGFLDVYFDNVGGEILDLCLNHLQKGARIAMCGAIADYGKKPKGLVNYPNIIAQRASVLGFLISDFYPHFGEGIAALAQWKAEGKIKARFHIEEGLERCPEHLLSLFKGANTGKMLVKVSQD